MKKLKSALIIGFALAEFGFADTPPDEHVGPAAVQSHADCNAYFGPMNEHHWSGDLQVEGRTITVELHCLTAGYCEYDVQQSRNKFANQGEVCGVLVMPDRRIRVSGRASGSRFSLVDAGLLIDPSHLEDEWKALVAHLTEVNLNGGKAAEAQRILALNGPNEVRIEIALTAENSIGLGLERMVPVAISGEESGLAHTTPCTRRTWVGHFKDLSDNFNDVRVETLDVAGPQPTHGGEAARVAAVTMRFRTHRLDGAVIAECHWPTRAAFVHTLQDMQDAGIDWYGGDFNDEARRIIERQTGISLTKEQFFRDLDGTFGDRDAASIACCRIQEVRHVSMIQTGSVNGPRLVGTVWLEEFHHKVVRMNGMVDRIGVPDPSAATCQVAFTRSYLAPYMTQNFDDFIVSLRRLPEQEPAPAAVSSK